MSSIAIENVSKRYNTFEALRGVSVDIRAGEFFSVLGPSGCGKSTLLRILAGFETPTGGDVRIGDRSMVGVPPNRRPTNLVFQNYAIFPHLNVQANVSYGLRHRGLTKAEMKAKTQETLGRVNLSGFGGRDPAQLSGGQLQRVALARALVCEPQVLLLDEPLGALDKKLRENMQMELRQLQRSVGITFVFVTHDQEEALTLSDRIAVMSKGQIIQVDTPSNIYDSPANIEVAKFIGTMNLVPAKVIEYRTGLTTVESAAGNIQVATDRVRQIGERVSVAIRPERLRVLDALSPVDGNLFHGKLVTQSFYGDRKHYHIEVPGISALVVVSAPALVPSLQTASRGDDIQLVWDPRDCLLLSQRD